MNSSRKTMPLGLFGLLTISALVDELTARSMSAIRGWKLPSSGVTTTGTPYTIFTISG